MSKVIAKYLGEEFVLLEDNEKVMRFQMGSLVTFDTTTLERNIAAIFLTVNRRLGWLL
jgi:hypothetical protein